MGILFRRFEDMKVWQEADRLALAIYKLLKAGNDFGFRDQIQRAAVSVMNNIAEGFERNSKKAFVNHLLIAKGSSGEVRSMLILGLQLGYLSEAEHRELQGKAVEISKMLQGLINAINTPL